MKSLVSFFSGIIFSIGLSFSGMINPEKVLGFLDVFGQWDYSLVFVMGGAVSVNLFLFYFILKRKPLLTKQFDLPLKQKIDKKLIFGSALFGVGWGIAGICPGPSVINLIRFESSPTVFFLAMLFGMLLHSIIFRNRT